MCLKLILQPFNGSFSTIFNCVNLDCPWCARHTFKISNLFAQTAKLINAPGQDAW